MARKSGYRAKLNSGAIDGIQRRRPVKVVPRARAYRYVVARILRCTGSTLRRLLGGSELTQERIAGLVERRLNQSARRWGRSG